MTRKGREPKHYQTPYGEVTVARHVSDVAGGRDVLSSGPAGPGGGGFQAPVCQAGLLEILADECCGAGAGMRWKEQGARIVLTLRSLTITEGRWGQFWRKVDQYGFALAG